MNLSMQAALNELGTQRALLGDRAASFASENSALRAEIDTLKARIAMLEKKQEPELKAAR